MNAFITIILLYAAVAEAIPNNGSKIVNGYQAATGQFPYQAALKGKNYKFICGASIISNRWLLSAAHCYASSDPIKYAGVGNNNINQQTNYNITLVAFKGNFSNATYINDIMLLKTSTPIIMIPGSVATISYNRDSSADNVLYSNMVFSGWGQTDTNLPATSNLMWVNYQMMSQVNCPSLNAQGGTGYPYETSSMICAYGTSLIAMPSGACFRDCGGPLVYNGVQYGIFARVMMPNTCASGYPDVFTRTSNFTTWITNIMANN